MFPDEEFAPAVPSFPVPVPLPTTDPDADPSFSICINEQWIPYVLGAMQQLVLQATWDTQDTDELNLVQSRAMKLIAMFSEYVMCCPCPQTRTVDGVPQFSFNGTDWFSYPGIMNNPGLNGQPKWLPDDVPDGQDARCLAAENIVSFYAQATANFLTLLGADTQIGDFIAGVTTIVAAFIEPVVILAWIVDFVAGLLTAGYEALVDAASDTNLELLRCAIFCHIGSDGAISTGQFQAIKDELSTSPGGAIGLYMTTWLDGLGPVGLMRQEKLGIVSADCTDCDCADRVVINYNFGSSGATDVRFGDEFVITAAAREGCYTIDFVIGDSVAMYNFRVVSLDGHTTQHCFPNEYVVGNAHDSTFSYPSDIVGAWLCLDYVSTNSDTPFTMNVIVDSVC